MDFGAMMFSTDYSIRPDDLAKMLEDRGFESMWVPEHTHIPADRTSPWPGGPDLPKDYWHTYDPFVALMAAAGATKAGIDGALALASEVYDLLEARFWDLEAQLYVDEILGIVEHQTRLSASSQFHLHSEYGHEDTDGDDCERQGDNENQENRPTECKTGLRRCHK